MYSSPGWDVCQGTDLSVGERMGGGRNRYEMWE